MSLNNHQSTTQVPQPQTAILPKEMQACVIIEANLIDITALDELKQACAQAYNLYLDKLKDEFPEHQLTLCIGFGKDLWTKFGHDNEGKELRNFEPLGHGLAPATQCDIVFHFQTMHFGACIKFASQIMPLFKNLLQVYEETHGYRLPEDRGHEGFVDGTENPQTLEARMKAAVIDAALPDAGGSYFLTQRYAHDFKRWDTIDEHRQAAIIGRTKKDNIEIPGEYRLETSHLGRVDITENGIGLKIVRQSLPFGTVTGQHGLQFIAYSHDLYSIDRQLQFMFGEADGRFDLMLRAFSTPISGGYYFVPSIERLVAL